MSGGGRDGENRRKNISQRKRDYEAETEGGGSERKCVKGMKEARGRRCWVMN